MLPDDLAELRTIIEEFLPDTLTVLFRITGPSTTDNTLSDGAGGVLDTSGSSTNGYVIGNTSPCRFERINRGIGVGETEISEATIQKDLAEISLPHDTEVYNDSIVRITFNGEVQDWEILHVDNNSDQLTKKLQVERIV